MMARGVALLVAVLFVITPFAPDPTLQHGVERPEDQGMEDGAVDGREGLDLNALLHGSTASFEENLGQLGDPGIRYYARGDPLSVAFGSEGVMYFYQGPDASFTFSMRLVAAHAVEPTGIGDLRLSSSYFVGKDASGWVSDARSYREVLYRDVYDGVDLRFYHKEGVLKYDLLVKPYVQPGVISLRYEGLDSVDVDPGTGDLLLRAGSVTLRDARPVVLQDGLGEDGTAPGSYRPTGDGTVCFALPEGVVRSLPLVIDPGIEFSTLIGGNEEELMTCCGVDPDGNIVMAGFADNASFPFTPGVFRTNGSSSKEQNLAVIKMDPTLSRPLFSTVIGGPLHDWAQDLEVGPDGRIFLVGAAGDGFPITEEAFDKDSGEDDDAFLLVLSSDGTQLLYSGFIGGDGRELGLSVHLYQDGSVLVLGSTNSSDLPTTPGAYQSTRMLDDAFVLSNQAADRVT